MLSQDWTTTLRGPFKSRGRSLRVIQPQHKSGQPDEDNQSPLDFHHKDALFSTLGRMASLLEVSESHSRADFSPVQIGVNMSATTQRRGEREREREIERESERGRGLRQI